MVLFERSFWNLNCWLNVESMDANWCILTVFERMVYEFGSAEKKWKKCKQGRSSVPSGASWNNFLEVETDEKYLKLSTLSVVIWIDVLKLKLLR